MKFRKTRTAARSVYIYRFADGTVAVLHPGEQGVSTEIIDFLHKLDDREVYRNLKQRKVKNIVQNLSILKWNLWKSSVCMRLCPVLRRSSRIPIAEWSWKETL